MKNYYKILGLEQQATQKEILSAFKRLRKKVHPDKLKGDEEPLKHLSKAYEVLSNPDKRSKYDQSQGGALMKTKETDGSGGGIMLPVKKQEVVNLTGGKLYCIPEYRLKNFLERLVKGARSGFGVTFGLTYSVTLLSVLLSVDFKSELSGKFLFPGATWHAIFVILFIISLVVMVVSIIHWYAVGNLDSTPEGIMKQMDQDHKIKVVDEEKEPQA